MDRDNHYETAFAAFLRERGIAHIAVDETHRSPLDDSPVKSLDFLITPTHGPQLLIDIKGRRFPGGSPDRPRHIWENWATLADIDGLTRWQEHFGGRAQALLVFVYQLADSVRLPIDTIDVWSYNHRIYLARAVPIDVYQRWMRCRSPRWRTVFIPGDIFREIVQPFSAFLDEPSDILWPG